LVCREGQLGLDPLRPRGTAAPARPGALSGQALADRRDDLLEALRRGRLRLTHTAPHFPCRCPSRASNARSGTTEILILPASALYSGGMRAAPGRNTAGSLGARSEARTRGSNRAGGAVSHSASLDGPVRGGVQHLAAAVAVGDGDVEPLAAYVFVVRLRVVDQLGGGQLLDIEPADGGQQRVGRHHHVALVRN